MKNDSSLTNDSRGVIDGTAAGGLTAAEARTRLSEVGENRFEESKSTPLWKIFLRQFKDFLIYVLFAAIILSAIMGEVVEATVIIFIVILNAVIGAIQEGKAEKALEALKELSSPTAIVVRDGNQTEIPAKEIVPGDLVVLDAGSVVPADLELIETANMKVEESALTGESVPVEKDANFRPPEGTKMEDIPLGDRRNMAYMGTAVTYGRGLGVARGTGMKTEMGKIAGMLASQKKDATPLEKRLDKLGKSLGIAALAICVLLFAIGFLQGRELSNMFLIAIAFAVSLIPEALPAIVAIVLALGVQRMVKVHSIIRKLPAVETLGSVNIVCTDKTGTLTLNRMTVEDIYEIGGVLNDGEKSGEPSELFMRGFVLCEDAGVSADGTRVGDPTELALIDYGIKHGIHKTELEKKFPRVGEIPFDSERKMMSTLHGGEQGSVLFTKGALDSILPLCSSLGAAEKKEIETAAANMAKDALRVLALAYKNGSELTEENLTFVGMVGLLDPPRDEAKQAVTEFKIAGVKTVMITGDHKDTAFAIAKKLGIAESESEIISGVELDAMSEEELAKKISALSVFARVSPEHKVRIVHALKAAGNTVSMTGDGVNDAPSLKAADIGVAMGITGTEVAKGAADLVLTDDNFYSIRLAIEEGRKIFKNIKKCICFFMASIFGEVITMLSAILIGFASPLNALQILWLNMLTDSMPALALGIDPDAGDVMHEKPRAASESFFAKGGLFWAVVYGIVIGLLSLAAFVYRPVAFLLSQDAVISLSAIKGALENPEIFVHAQTYAFITICVSQLMTAVCLKDIEVSIFKTNHLKNKVMILSYSVGLALQIAVCNIPFLETVFKTTSLSLTEWLAIIAFATVPIWVHEIVVLARKIRHRP